MNSDDNFKENFLSFATQRMEVAFKNLEADPEYRNVSAEYNKMLEEVRGKMGQPFSMALEEQISERFSYERDVYYSQGVADGIRLKDIAS